MYAFYTGTIKIMLLLTTRLLIARHMYLKTTS